MILYGINDSINDFNNCPNVNNEQTNSNNLNNENYIVEGFLGSEGSGENVPQDNPASKAMAWFKGKQFKTLFLAALIINLIAFVVIIIAIILIFTLIGSFPGIALGGGTFVLTLIVNFIIFVVGLFQFLGSTGMI